ncbi:MAG: DNA polymerase III subunit delta' [Firmicutes bacterium]|nr:DNA polymerase III subunit delta' [Bacillota bacterium]
MRGFDSLIGQDALVKRLRQAIESGRVAHAYLISGAPGSGKKTLALGFAQALFCQHQHGDACGECRNCRRIESRNHPDVIIIEPESDRIRINQIRSFRDKFTLQAYEGGWKIGIITDADAMTEAAANSLLKVLEEPSGQAVIMLLTTSSSVLLPTIVSRCQTIPMARIPRIRIASFLETEHNLPSETAIVIAGLADGRLGQAIEMASIDNLEWKERVLAMVTCREGRGLEALRLATALSAEPEAIEFCLRVLTSWLRDMLLVSSGCPQAMITHQDRYSELIVESKTCDEFVVSQAIIQVEDARRALQANANRRLTLDALLYQMADLTSFSPVSEVYKYGKSSRS